MSSTRFFLVSVLLLLVATRASGSTILIGPDLELESGWIPGIFENESTDFSNAGLTLIHESLVDSGVETDGYISILNLETDHGLALVFLVDALIGTDGTYNTSVWFQSSAPVERMRYINDEADDVSGHFTGNNGTQVAYGHFTWNSLQGGDAFAWAGLLEGDNINTLFAAVDGELSTFPGLFSSDTIQFISWNSTGWSVADTASFSSANLYGFSARVVPTPGALGLFLVGALAYRRHRR